MVREKISSQTDRQTRRIHKRLFSYEKSAKNEANLIIGLLLLTDTSLQYRHSLFFSLSLSLSLSPSLSLSLSIFLAHECSIFVYNIFQYLLFLINRRRKQKLHFILRKRSRSSSFVHPNKPEIEIRKENPDSETNDNKNKFECFSCRDRFRSRNSWKKHVKLHSGEMMQCIDCESSITSNFSLHRHQSSIPAASSFECDICNKQCSSITCWRNHKRSHRVSSVLHKKVGAPIATGRESEDIMINWSTESDNVCDDCGEVFTELSRMKMHMFNKVEGIWFQCAVCVRQFPSKFCLNNHKKVHSESSSEKHSNNINIGDCVSETMVLEFKSDGHNISKKLKSFSCPMCSKNYCYKGNLKVHLNSHTGEKPFECIDCGRHFFHKNVFLKHKMNRYGGGGGRAAVSVGRISQPGVVSNITKKLLIRQVLRKNVILNGLKQLQRCLTWRLIRQGIVM